MWLLSWSVSFASEPAAPAPAPPAGPPSAAAVSAAVDAVYGKHVPESGICVEHPELPTVFHGAPTPVGVKRGALGCTLLGVMVGGAWFPPESALAAALDPAAYLAFDGPTRESTLLAWTDRVLLAFHQPRALGVVLYDARSRKTTVDRQYFRRDSESGQVADAVTKWVYGPDLAATPAAEQILAHHRVRMYLRPDHLVGLSEAVVTAALESQGRVVRQCYSDAWERDLGLEGRIVLEWSVAAGKVGDVALVSDTTGGAASLEPRGSGDPDLAKCYARAVRAGTYPADAIGKVSYIFAVDRDVLAP